MMNSIFNIKVTVILSLLLVCMITSVFAQDGIESVSPTSATQGDNGVVVTIILESDTAPPSQVNPNSVTIGTLTGINTSRSDLTITSTFDFPSDMTPASYDVSVEFPTPEGTLTFTEAGGFTVLSSTSVTVYVDIDNTSGTYDGTSWATAYQTIQEGIDAANAAGAGEVWVAEGTYYIYTTSSDSTVQLKSNVSLYGGFNGTETTVEQRDWETHMVIIDGHEYTNSPNQVEHVVTISEVDNVVVDGFTITGGKANQGMPRSSRATTPNEIFDTNGANTAGGMLIWRSAPTVNNCIITGNEALKGGGVYIMVATEWPIINTNPAPTFTNCEISNNTASTRGGGISIDVDTHPTFINCKFLNNTCDAKGGAIYNDWSCSPIFKYCLIAKNTAERATAMGNDGSSSPTLTNCTITDNYAYDIGAGMYTGSYSPAGNGTNEPILVNCIVWGNENQYGGPADLVVWHENYFHLSYSLIGNGFNSNGDGVFIDDPLFIDPDNNDYSLQAGSPCIDAGSPDTTGLELPSEDLAGNPTVYNNTIDIGAYEYQSQVYLPNIVTEPANNDTLAFGNVSVQSTTTDSIKVKNTGNATLILNSLTLSDTAFQWVFPPSTPYSLAAGDSIWLKIAFTPTDGSTYVETATIANDDENVAITLTGIGIAPMITASPDSLDFGRVEAGTSDTLYLTVSNTGTDNLEISSLSIQDFTIPETPPFIVGVDADLQLSVAFNPEFDQDSVIDTLHIISDALNSPDVPIKISGVSIQPPVVALPDGRSINEDTPGVIFTDLDSFAVDQDGQDVTWNLVDFDVSKLDSVKIQSGDSLKVYPKLNENGATWIKLLAADPDGLTDTDSISITINSINDPPEFTSTPITTATQNVEYTYTITVIDIEDGGGTITTPILPNWLNLAENGSTALIGTPTSADVGTHDVVLKVTDSGDAFALQEFTITVSGTGSVEGVFYVDTDNTSGTYDGTSWATAFQTVQEAIDAVVASGDTGQVWVAEGTYYPTTGSDRSISIAMKAGAKIYGGFNGTETDLSQRDFVNHVTILSGNIGGISDSTDNSYHVLTGADSSLIDGFTVTGGYANGQRTERLGGGLYAYDCEPAIYNCTFTDNYGESGGGLYMIAVIEGDHPTPIIENCTFTNNQANNGGAILLRVGVDANVKNCTFTNNFAEWRGGAFFINYGASPTIDNCTFSTNSTHGNGGAIYTDDQASQIGGTYPVVQYSTFDGNTAVYRGGAMANYNSNNYPDVTSCDFQNNTAGAGGGAIANNYYVQLTVTNSTFANNSGGTGDNDIDSDDTCTVTLINN